MRMKVHIKQMGWHGGTSASLWTPWWTYLLTAENGIIVKVHSTVWYDDGDYELKDEDWSYDNPRWDKLIEQDCEEIEIE